MYAVHLVLYALNFVMYAPHLVIYALHWMIYAVHLVIYVVRLLIYAMHLVTYVQYLDGLLVDDSKNYHMWSHRQVRDSQHDHAYKLPRSWSTNRAFICVKLFSSAA
jgi:hypothetical protein